jgi:hypothetical protein
MNTNRTMQVVAPTVLLAALISSCAMVNSQDEMSSLSDDAQMQPPITGRMMRLWAGLLAEIEQDLPFLASLGSVNDGDLVYEKYFNYRIAQRIGTWIVYGF